jgi:hypothetical protein
MYHLELTPKSDELKKYSVSKLNIFLDIWESSGEYSLEYIILTFNGYIFNNTSEESRSLKRFW